VRYRRTATYTAGLAIIGAALLRPINPRVDPVPSQLDATVSLHGGFANETTLNVESVDRLTTALVLANCTESLIVTTESMVNYRGRSFDATQDHRDRVTKAGLLSRWRLVGPVGNTHDEAIAAARLLLPSHRHIGVVTSPLHTRRACATFERAGFQVTCIATRIERHVYHDRVYERLAWIKFWLHGWV
jgi:uncharacterized SAM-binding protein YcdF (DUF218 family)